MATIYGVNATKAANASGGVQQLIDEGAAGGRGHWIYDEYTIAADIASGDVLRMGSKLPPKARVCDVILVFTDLDASGGTLDVGWEANSSDVADPDGFLADVDVTSAGTVSMMANQENMPGQYKQFHAGSETQVSITFDGDTDATTGTIKLAISYIID